MRTMIHALKSRNVQKAVIALIWIGASANLLLFGLFGLGRTLRFNYDGQALYAAGRAWLAGLNPYSFGDLLHGVHAVPGVEITSIRFFYPPQSGAICVALGMLPYSAAKFAWLGCNLLALVCAIMFVQLMLRDHPAVSDDRAGSAIVAAVILGTPFVGQVIWMGQTSLVVSAASLGTWHFSRHKRWIAAGICLGFASIKPQLCVLVGFWLLLERDWKTLAVGAVSALALALYPIVTQGPVHSLLAWRDGVAGAYAMPSNLPSWPHKVGLQSMLSAIGISAPNWVWLGIGLLFAAAQWKFRARIDRGDWLALLMINCFVFSPFIHDYDYAALVPIYASMWRYGRTSVEVGAAAVVLLVVLFVPLPLVPVSRFPFLAHWRTVVMLAFAALFMLFGYRGARDAERYAQGAA